MKVAVAKRLFEGLALSTMIVGVACSSSSDVPTGGTTADSGVDSTTDARGDAPVVVPPEEAGDAYEPTKTVWVGDPCPSDRGCDEFDSGIHRCSDSVFPGGPRDPTPICVQSDSSDVCTPSDGAMLRFCDGNHGLCTKSGTDPAICQAMCVMNADGTWAQKCAGKNGCNVEAFGTDSMTLTISMIGTCRDGCRTDVDCPSGSKCDPVQRFCAKTCSADTDCTAGWKGAPANWKCDTARGACTFVFPKKLGDVCSTADDCLCFKNKVETNGYCIEHCRVGDSCATGFTCDPLLPAKDPMGMPLFTLTTLPAELVGSCLKNCVVDADCPANQTCDASAGLTQKTCRPRWGTADAGM